jgi:hypothetical protein
LLKTGPSHGNDFFQSVTFTNGGMKYDLINFRLGQTLLRNPYIGPFMAALRCTSKFFLEIPSYHVSVLPVCRAGVSF